MIAAKVTLDPILYVLNPVLYRLLARRIGEVRVTHRGEARVVRAVSDWEPGEPRVRVLQHGEQYTVNCLVCGDRRQQLSINHMYGQSDGSDGRLLNLAYCHASNCMARGGNRDALAARLGTDDQLEFARIRPWGRRTGTSGSEETPTAIRLDQLPQRHRARTYLSGRGLDPDKVGRFYGASYIEEGRSRIIVPVNARDTRWGWWTMTVPESATDHPAGTTGESVPATTATGHQPPYNLDLARQYMTGVIVTTPPHVWAVGPMGIYQPSALVPEHTFREAAAAFARHTLVVLVATEDRGRVGIRKMTDYFSRRMPGRFAVAELTAAALAAKLDRKSLRNEVRRQAQAQGVEVEFTRRE
jgi:hypothetical protein